MTKILFLYNNLNDVKGISTAMQVAERYARYSNLGKFWVNTHPDPSIKFEEGSTIVVKPISRGLSNINEYDEVYIDDTINTFMETSGLGEGYNFYNNKSFTKNV